MIPHLFKQYSLYNKYLKNRNVFYKVESRGLDAGHVGVMTAGGIIGTGFKLSILLGQVIPLQFTILELISACYWWWCWQ